MDVIPVFIAQIVGAVVQVIFTDLEIIKISLPLFAAEFALFRSLHCSTLTTAPPRSNSTFCAFIARIARSSGTLFFCPVYCLLIRFRFKFSLLAFILYLAPKSFFNEILQAFRFLPVFAC